MNIFDIFFIISLFEIYTDDGGWLAWTYVFVYFILATLLALAHSLSDD